MNSYTSFDFVNHQGWQNYLKNIYPNPTIPQIQRIKRKWYKNNIDQDFDLDFDKQQPQETNNSQSNQPQQPQQQQQTQQNKAPLDFYYKLEGILKFAYFIMVFLSAFQAKLAIALISFLQLKRTQRRISFTKEYFFTIMKSEFTANFLYVIVISLSKPQESFLILLPPSIHILIGLIEFYYRTGIDVLQKYEKVSAQMIFIKTNRNYLITAKNKIEVAMLIYLIGLWVLGHSSFLQLVLYVQYLTAKNKFNDFMKMAHQEINTFLTQQQESSMIYRVLLKIFNLYDKLIKMF